MAFVPRLALSTRFAPRAIVPLASTFVRPSAACIGSRYFHATKMTNHPIATLDVRIEEISCQEF
jgi:cyanate lyase